MAATMEGAGVGLSAIPRVAEPEEITGSCCSSPPTTPASRLDRSSSPMAPATGSGAGIQAAAEAAAMQYREGLKTMSDMNTSTNLAFGGFSVEREKTR